MINIINNTIDKLTTQKTTQKLNENELLILKYIKENKYITRKELSDKLNINKLKKLNVIKRVGSDRAGYYEIIDDNYI